MSQPFVGEIRIFGGNFAPQGWAFCHGQAMSIAENDVLFAIIGTTYGGDGITTFNLPDLRGRLPMHQGGGPGLSTRVIGEQGGVESVTLTTQQIPAHTHQPSASTGLGNQTSPAGGVWAASGSGAAYSTSAASVSMQAGLLDSVGGSQPHENMMPSLVLNFIIALYGVYPNPA